MKRKRWTPEEWAAFDAEAEAGIRRLRDRAAQIQAELEERRRREAEESRRGWRRLLAR